MCVACHACAVHDTASADWLRCSAVIREKPACRQLSYICTQADAEGKKDLLLPYRDGEKRATLADCVHESGTPC